MEDSATAGHHMAGRLVRGLFARILCGAVFALVKWPPGRIGNCRLEWFCRCPVGLALDDVTSA